MDRCRSDIEHRPVGTPPRRRRTVVVSGLALLAAMAVVVAVGRPDSSLVQSAGWGNEVTWSAWEPVASWLPDVRVPRTRRALNDREGAWVVLNGPRTGSGGASVTLVATCGCRFAGTPFPFGARAWVWQLPPSLGSSVNIEVEADGREQVVTLERPSPDTARVATPDRPVLPLPWSGDVLGERIELRESEGSVLVRWRPVGEPPPSATARDYDGRAFDVPRQTPDWERWSDIPFGTRLCPHGPWWEIEFANPGAEPTVLRFACPTAWTLPRAPK